MNEQKKHGDVGPQYLAAIIVNALTFAYGIEIGWASPMQPLLQANVTNTSEISFWDSGVTGMTDEAFSWIGGIYCIGGTVATPVYGYLANAVGRKKALIYSGIPLVFSFALKTIATNSLYLFTSRALGGLAGAGCFVVVPMYIGEMAEDSVRGVLGAMLNLFLTIGILAGYIVGSYTSYMSLALFGLFCSISFLIMVMWVPESPVYSLISERPDEAFNALIKLHGNHTELVQQEIDTITAQIKQTNSRGELSVNAMLRDPPTRKALIIILTLATIMQSSGIAPIIAYSVSIFEAAGSTLSPAISAIIIGALQIAGAIIGTALMDKAGRKMLLMISGAGMTVTLAPIAYFLYLKNHDADVDLLASIGWLPVTSMAVFIVVYGLGFGPVPFVLLSEMFNNEAKSAASSISMTHMWAISFFYLKFFSNISGALGIETCFALFALCTGAGTVFTHFCVFETKGKSQDEIQYLLGHHQEECDSPTPFLEKYVDNITLEANEKA